MTDSKRERMAPNGDARFVRREEHGRFKESDDAGRSLAQDQRIHAQTTVKPGQGDRGDQAKCQPPDRQAPRRLRD